MGILAFLHARGSTLSLLLRLLVILEFPLFSTFFVGKGEAFSSKQPCSTFTCLGEGRRVPEHCGHQPISSVGEFAVLCWTSAALGVCGKRAAPRRPAVGGKGAPEGTVLETPLRGEGEGWRPCP